MLAVSCRRQQQANSINLAPQQLGTSYPGPGVGMSTLLTSPYRDGKAKRTDGMHEDRVGIQLQDIANLGCLEVFPHQIDRSGFIKSKGPCGQCIDESYESVRVLEKFGWLSNSDSTSSVHVSQIQTSRPVLCISHFQWITDYSQNHFFFFRPPRSRWTYR